MYVCVFFVENEFTKTKKKTEQTLDGLGDVFCFSTGASQIRKIVSGLKKTQELQLTDEEMEKFSVCVCVC